MEEPHDNILPGTEPSSAPALPPSLAKRLGKMASRSATSSKIPAAKPAVAIAVKAGSETTSPPKADKLNSPKNVEFKVLEPGETEDEAPLVKADQPKSSATPRAASADETLDDDTLDDDKTDAAVDDIMHRESDRLLDVDEHAARPPASMQRPHHKRHLFGGLLHSSLARWLTFLLLLAAAGTVFALPTSRYWVLNHAGVRASLGLTVTDGGTLLPLQGVTVSIDGQQATTDAHGVATVHHLHLGPEQFTLSRVAFASQTHGVTVGWGENPMGSFVLQPTGVHYGVRAVDYFSGKPVLAAHAMASDGTTATADKTGLITLTLDTNGSAAAQASVAADGYVAASTTLKPGSSNTVTLVPAQKDVYVAKSNGIYNVYEADADGANAKVLLAGTGLETPSAMALQTSPDGAYVALVAVRDHTVNASGAAQQVLTLVNVASGAVTVLDHADSIKLVGWSGNAVVYELAAAATGTVNPSRVRVISYNYATSTRAQLAAANDLNAFAMTSNAFYYAVGSSDPSASADFFRVGLDGSGKQTVLGQEVIGVYRTDYSTLLLQTGGGWFSYVLDGSAAPASITPPSTYPNYNVVLSPDGKYAAYLSPAGIQLVTVASGKTATLAVPVGATYPLHWLNNSTLVFRAGGTTAASDYGVSMDGGAAKKVVSVTNVAGFAVTP